jgi:hypothetical protein
MVIETITGEQVPEVELAEHCREIGIYNPDTGSMFYAATRQLLLTFDIEATSSFSKDLLTKEQAVQRFAQLLEATKGGHPAVVQLKSASVDTMHAVVVDYIAVQGQDTWVFLRDPWPMTQAIPASVGDFFNAAGWTGKQVLRVEEFFKNWTGGMITTGPVKTL